MPKIKLEDALDKYELQDYEEKNNLAYFEKYCGSCDLYNTVECPNYTNPLVMKDTKWKDIGCDKFID